MLYVEDSEAPLPVAVSPQAYDELWDALAIEDRYGLQELILSGRVFPVPNNTKILVLNTGGFQGMERFKVRILEGDYLGSAGWVPWEWVRNP